MTSEDVTCGPKGWEIVGAVHGRGTLLMGPFVSDAGHAGAWVFAPPGVRLATPASDDPNDPPLSVFGWRQALWMPNEKGDVIIDHARPEWLEVNRLSDVLSHVLEHCPEHLGWVKERLAGYVTTLHLQTRCDAAGRRAPSAHVAERTMADLIADGEEALAEHEQRLAEPAILAAAGGDHLLHPGSLTRLRAALDGYAARVAGMDRRELLDEALERSHPRKGNARPR